MSVPERCAGCENRLVIENDMAQAERLSSLGHLAATIAHEFNNILMGIQPFAELIQLYPSDAARHVDAADRILRSVERGRQVTREILRFTQPAEPQISRIDVDSWLQQIGTEMRPQLPGGIELDLAVFEPGLALAGDVVQLTQAVTNLVVNGRDAMPGGGKLTIAAERADAFVRLSVSDAGCGIPREVQARIFEPLFTTKKGGTGLGLAVVHQVVTKHGGTIRVESEAARGTVVHLLLPADGSRDSHAGQEPVTATAAGTSPGGTIVLVEDDPIVAEGTAMLLEAEGYRVRTVSRGLEAEGAIEELHPDVVILDLGLPDVDGAELYQALVVRHPSPAYLFATGHGDVATLDRLTQNGRTGFIQKPYSSATLLGLIREIVSRPEVTTSAQPGRCITVSESPRKWPFRIAIPMIVAAAVAVIAAELRMPPAPTISHRVQVAVKAAPSVRKRYENPEWENLVDAATRTALLPFPVDDLNLKRQTFRGAESGSDLKADRPGDLVPAGVVIDDVRPRFSWPARPGCSYVVTVVDGDTVVGESAPLSVSHWTIDRDLRRGRRYVWQVELRGGDGVVEIVPDASAPPAMFRVVNASRHDELVAAAEQHPEDHLLLSVLHARAGMRSEALRQLQLCSVTDVSVRSLRQRYAQQEQQIR